MRSFLTDSASQEGTLADSTIILVDRTDGSCSWARRTQHAYEGRTRVRGDCSPPAETKPRRAGFDRLALGPEIVSVGVGKASLSSQKGAKFWVRAAQNTVI